MWTLSHMNDRWAMLSDRGFWNTACLYPIWAEGSSSRQRRFLLTWQSASWDIHVRWPSLGWLTQMVCKMWSRMTSSTFPRVTDTNGLQDVISHDFFDILDAMNHWGHMPTSTSSRGLWCLWDNDWLVYWRGWWVCGCVLMRRSWWVPARVWQGSKIDYKEIR
jgi:hypothetical protein